MSYIDLPFCNLSKISITAFPILVSKEYFKQNKYLNEYCH